MNERCECCWTVVDSEVIGTLRIMGRVVKVCQDCVNFMWHGRHPMEGENIAGETYG